MAESPVISQETLAEMGRRKRKSTIHHLFCSTVEWQWQISTEADVGSTTNLVQGILQELRLPSPGSALEIPLAEVGGTGLARLRSAVHRASISEGLSIETLADGKNFYVWTKPSPK
jgi:hypothetical protein